MKKAIKRLFAMMLVVVMLFGTFVTSLAAEIPSAQGSENHYEERLSENGNNGQSDEPEKTPEPEPETEPEPDADPEVNPEEEPEQEPEDDEEEYPPYLPDYEYDYQLIVGIEADAMAALLSPFSNDNNEFNARIEDDHWLRWDPVPGAFAYRLIVRMVPGNSASDSTHPALIFGTQFDMRTFHLPLPISTSYPLWVFAVNNQGQLLEWVNWWSILYTPIPPRSSMNVRIEGSMLVWDPVSGAERYSVELFDPIRNTWNSWVYIWDCCTSVSKYLFYCHNRGVANRIRIVSGDYNWNVISVSHDFDFTFSIPRASHNIRVEGNLLRWDSISGADFYEIHILDTETGIWQGPVYMSGDVYRFVVLNRLYPTLNPGQNNQIRITARFVQDFLHWRDGIIKNISPDFSFMFAPTRLQAPQNFSVNGSIISWDPVQGAGWYHIQVRYVCELCCGNYWWNGAGGGTQPSFDARQNPWLPPGEHTFRVIAENMYGDYIPSLPSAEVTAQIAVGTNITGHFTCPNLLAAVRDAAGLESNAPVFELDAARLEWLYGSNRGITDLAGLEYLVNLRYLSVRGNQLTSLDVSALGELVYLDASNNSLTSVDLSGNPRMRTVYLGDNQLTSLNTSGLTNLSCLDAPNNELATIDLAQNIDILSLNLSGNNFTSIDLSQNINLWRLNLSGNNFASIDLSQNTWIVDLNLSSNQLTNMNFSANVGLVILNVSENKLTSLDVSGLDYLEVLYANVNYLTSLNVTGLDNLWRLHVVMNYLGPNPDLTVIGRNSELQDAGDGFWDNFRFHPQRLEAPWTDIITNDFTCPNLRAAIREIAGRGPNDPIIRFDVHWIRTLDVSYRNITSLAGLQHFNYLERLAVNNNNLTSLDLSANTSLLWVDASWNNINSVNVTQNTALKELFLGNNNLQSINVSNNIQLINLFLAGNDFCNALDVSALVNLRQLWIGANPRIDYFNVSSNVALGGFSTGWNNLYGLDVSDIIDLDWLWVSNNNMTEPDDVIGWRDHFIFAGTLQTDAFWFWPQKDGTVPGFITVSSNVIARRGNEVTVEIRIDDNPGFAGLSLQVCFPPELQLVMYQLGDIELISGLTMPHGTSPGVRITNPISNSFFLTWGRSENFFQDGVLVRLTFSTDANASPGLYEIALTFATSVGPSTPVNADEVELNIGIRNGFVQLNTFILGSVTGSGYIDVADLVRLARFFAGHGVDIDAQAAKVTAVSIAEQRLDVRDLVRLARFLAGHDVVLGG